MSSEVGLLRDLGLITCIPLGVVLGCMSGTLIGALVGSAMSEMTASVSNEKLPGDMVVVPVDVEDNTRKQAVRSIMEDCGAVAIAVGQEKPPRDNGLVGV